MVVDPTSILSFEMVCTLMFVCSVSAKEVRFSALLGFVKGRFSATETDLGGQTLEYDLQIAEICQCKASFRKQRSPILPDNLSFFKDELSFFILLALIISLLILPPKNLLALRTEHISHCVQTCHKVSIFFWTHRYIGEVGKKKCSSISSLEGLRDDIVVGGDGVTAIATAVVDRTEGEVRHSQRLELDTEGQDR